MYTKNDLKEHLKTMGLTGEETILIHSSMKSIGDVQDRAEGVLDVLIDYFKNGLLLFPTHTWKTVNSENPVYNPYETPSCVGILTNLFMKRDGNTSASIRNLQCWQEIGKDAALYLAGEENCNTPCTPGGCYDRLRQRNAKILLVGVGHGANNFYSQS